MQPGAPGRSWQQDGREEAEEEAAPARFTRGCQAAALTLPRRPSRPAGTNPGSRGSEPMDAGSYSAPLEEWSDPPTNRGGGRQGDPLPTGRTGHRSVPARGAAGDGAGGGL